MKCFDTVPSNADQAGVLAQDFSESFGMEQLVNFPTRGENTLDLVLSDIEGRAVERPGFGNSDHQAVQYDDSK